MDLSSTSLQYDTAPEEMLIYDEEPSFALTNDTFMSVEDQFSGDYINAEFHERSTILVDGGENFGVSAVAFDTHEELLWMGNQGGHVTSYYGADLQKYTSFQVHVTDEIRCLHTIDGGILSLSPNSLRYQMRRGLPLYTHSSVNMEEMQCLIPMKHSPDSFLLGGHNPRIIELNLAEGRELQMIDVGEGGCAIMRQQSRFLCCGDPSGKVELRDPITLKVEHSLETHSASLSDFDVHGNLLVTCGFSNRQGALSCDTLLLVFDLRMLRALAPINVLLDPLLLRFMPSFSSRLAVASPTGQLQFVETVVSEPDMTLYQVNWPSAGCVVSSLDVCSSSQAVVVGGSGGSLHLMSSTHSPLYNPFSRQTEFADPIETYDPPINLDDTMAVLAAIPLPLSDGLLFSDWPKQFVSRGYRRTPPIDPEILKTMKMQGTVGYAPNPNTRRRNQVSEIYTRRTDGGRGNTPSVTGCGEDQSGFVAIPKRYRKPDIKYNKAGGQLTEGESDIDHYSKSGLSGLEATLPNSYCNAMLQVLYFTESIRGVMLAHQCSAEFCVCCELGFLFHMLGSGAPCHSGNLLRALRSAKEASALRLILSDTSAQDANLLLLIQSWNRFILHQMHSELLETKRKEAKIPTFVYRDTDFPCIELQNQRKKRVKPELAEEMIEGTTRGETEVSWLFGSKQTHIFTCLKCNNKSSKEATLLVHNLVYPHNKGQISSLSLGENNEVSFCQILQMSVGGSQITPAWCEPCYKFQPTLQERKVKTLPPILSVNCGNNNESDKKFWKDQMDAVVLKVLQGSGDLKASSSLRQCRYGSACTRVGCRFKHPQQMTELGISVPSHLYQSHSWVPLSLKAALSNTGQLTINANITSSETNKTEVTYNLYAVVCYVNDEKKNIIAIINVASAHHTPMWYIFNDFSITPVGGHEAVWFSMDWKVPCVLYWRQNSASPLENDFGVGDVFAVTPSAISPEVLINVPKCATIIPLSPSEIPKQSDLVAIDAEFVTLNQEESELRSDGKLATVKPSHMSVARISCVRGQGPLEGTAFIDDYISTQEQVYDYLTKFSGIKPGDLDATCSSKNLTTLKSTYLKLRYLIDNGVIFVGHGLNNDFRVINVVVPPNQIIDTVQLFYLPHQRMVSLRFLAWHFIGIKIQSETHDSIEDARAALRLYKKYLELEAQGILQSSLEEMYTVGKSLHWKVPGVDTD